MLQRLFLFFVLSLMSPSLSMAVQPPTAEAIIRHVDELRLPPQSLTMDLTITPFKDGVADDPSLYTLYCHKDGDNLLKAQSLDQRGQKFLTTDKGIWFYAPRTRRAIRLTPLQTLRGQASIGDITRMRWSRDYDAALEDPWHDSEAGGRIWLVLKAKSDLSTYATIKLAVRDSDFAPVTAQLYAASGRLLKTAEFSPPTSTGHSPAVRYIDAVDRHKETLVEAGIAKLVDLPLSMFNPRALEE